MWSSPFSVRKMSTRNSSFMGFPFVVIRLFAIAVLYIAVCNVFAVSR